MIDDNSDYLHIVRIRLGILSKSRISKQRIYDKEQDKHDVKHTVCKLFSEKCRYNKRIAKRKSVHRKFHKERIGILRLVKEEEERSYDCYRQAHINRWNKVKAVKYV